LIRKNQERRRRKARIEDEGRTEMRGSSELLRTARRESLLGEELKSWRQSGRKRAVWDEADEL